MPINRKHENRSKTRFPRKAKNSIFRQKMVSPGGVALGRKSLKTHNSQAKIQNPSRGAHHTKSTKSPKNAQTGKTRFSNTNRAKGGGDPRGAKTSKRTPLTPKSKIHLETRPPKCAKIQKKHQKLVRAKTRAKPKSARTFDSAPWEHLRIICKPR